MISGQDDSKDMIESDKHKPENKEEVKQHQEDNTRVRRKVDTFVSSTPGNSVQTLPTIKDQLEQIQFCA